MERRIRTRYAIHLLVKVIDKYFSSWDFILEDFGLDGLYLTCKDGVADSIEVDDILDLQFELKEANIPQSYAFKIKVLRKLDSSLAIAIYHPAYEALLRYSKRQQNPVGDARAKEIYTELENKFLSHLADCMDSFFPLCNDFLFAAAEKASSNVEQNFFFDTINNLNNSAADLKNKFIEILSEKLELGNHDFLARNNSSSANFQELDLLAQNDFEDWLVVDKIIKSSVPQYKQQLSDIDQRLVSLLSIDSEAPDYNPFYPDSIFNSFNESVHYFFTDNHTSAILCKEFEKSVNVKLSDAYDDLNQLFIDNGVLTVIDKKELEIRKSDVKTSSRDKQPERNEKNTAAALPHQQAAKTQSELAPAQASASRAGKNKIPIQSTAANMAANRNVYNQPGKSTQYVTEVAALENTINLNNAYRTIKELLSFKTGHPTVIHSAEFYLSETYTRQLEKLIDELTILHQSGCAEKQITPTALNEFVMSHIAKESYSETILNELNYALDILGRLFTVIFHDEWLSAEAKMLISALQLPLLKVALINKDFFASWSHPARMVINKLALINFADENSHYYPRAKSYIDMIVNDFDKDLSIFEKVQEVLTHLLDLQTSQYNSNVEKVTAYWDSLQTIALDIANRLADKSIPVIIADFISYHWLQILLNTYQAQGKDSIEWQQYSQVLDVCVISRKENLIEHEVGVETILFIIKKGLSQSGLYNKKIVDNIAHLLQNHEPLTSIMLSKEMIYELLINGFALTDETAIEQLSQQTTASKEKQIGLINTLNINDYLIYKQKTKNVRLQLVWKSADLNVLVLTGRNGQQEAVLSRSEVVSLLEKRKLYQSHYFELPLLERSVYSILGEVHEKLAEDTQIDTITNFMLRKEFEHVLTIRLSDHERYAKSQNYHIALCMINFDRFSLINNTFGFECGDQYLAEVAELISKSLPEDVVIGRYGIDEFIILFNDLSEKQLIQQAEQLRHVIQKFNFAWKDKNFSLSASIGVTMADVRSTTMKRLLNAAASAMSLAKEQGRNRVYFFAENDAGLNYRQQLQLWATKVEQMITHRQLDIRFHRIQPLSSQLPLHYEVLLVVKDETGNFSSPAAFIEAAELYNKMALVDQWVIENVFEWCHRYPVHFERMGSVAINLSGHSLNSVDFIDFIAAKFKQYDIDPCSICFEITETVAIANFDCTNRLIQNIKAMGCKFSLDDFGTGMSSYAYLKNFPVDFLKIDGVFIKDLAVNETDQAMVKSINEIGHFLGLQTIAEYVENDKIIEVLNTIGVDYAQGFGIEKPVMMCDFEKSFVTPEPE